jgi:isopropylmalate/homocitrate/citramalate synthase
MLSYPKSANSFIKLCTSNEKILNEFIKISNVRPFDVSLRDGIQSLNISEKQSFTTSRKKELYNHIIHKYSPKNIEIGSYVNKKVLPIFSDTEELFTFVEKGNKYYEKLINNYVLVPNEDQLLIAIKNGVKNFSFITSVSNKFQLKNTKMNLEESDRSIYNMLHLLDDSPKFQEMPSVKLYVSCINECPIEGKIDNDFIVKRLLQLNKMNVDTICLSDTRGTLTNDDFEYILDTCHYFGIPASKFSLHLHVKNEREYEVEKIFHTALDRKIISFDVSVLESGGCSVTMDKNQISPNLSYDLYYKFLFTYIVKKINNK